MRLRSSSRARRSSLASASRWARSRSERSRTCSSRAPYIRPVSHPTTHIATMDAAMGGFPSNGNRTK
jgi:hypothetical protein